MDSYLTTHVCELAGIQLEQSRYLLALCCMQLGNHAEAEKALAPDAEGHVPNGAAGHYLLGRLARLTNRLKPAIQHFSMALQYDPLLWCAYEELCILGALSQTKIPLANPSAAPYLTSQPYAQTPAPRCHFETPTSHRTAITH